MATLGIEERGEPLFGGAARQRVVSVKALSLGVPRDPIPINRELAPKGSFFPVFLPFTIALLLLTFLHLCSGDCLGLSSPANFLSSFAAVCGISLFDHQEDLFLGAFPFPFLQMLVFIWDSGCGDCVS